MTVRPYPQLLLLVLLAGVVRADAADSVPLPCAPHEVVAGLFDADAGCVRESPFGAAAVVAAVIHATRPVCPAPATVELGLAPSSLSEVHPVRFFGRRSAEDCTAGALATTYEVSAECGAGVSPCAQVGGLAPGRWIHSMELESGGPAMPISSLVIASAEASGVEFPVYASVRTVTSAADDGPGTLREVIRTAPTLAKPLWVRFDELAFPPGRDTVVSLRSPLPPLDTDHVTIDGRDSAGRSRHRILDAGGAAVGVLSITGSHNRLVGLGFRNVGENNRDVINFSGEGSTANRVEDCMLANSASADVIGSVDGAGRDFSDGANVVAASEIWGADDKGIKVTTGSHLLVADSWVHHNRNGGVQATLGGRVRVVDSVVESNGGGSGQNGLAVQAVSAEGDLAYLESEGTISRANDANGISVRGGSAFIRDTYAAGNGTAGLRIFNDTGDPAEASVEGTSAVCNRGDGAVVADGSLADFGGGALLSSGGNAFAQNNLPAGFANLRNATGMLASARYNQWEHCGRGTRCDEAAIRARDLSDGGRSTDVSSAIAHRGSEAPTVTSVKAGSGVAGERVRIFGRGFNAIDGLFAEDQCLDVAGRNRCVPLRGNCVRIGGVPAAVEAVTPTMLVVRRPFTCLAGAELTVTVDKGAGGVSSPPVDVCQPVR